MKKFFHSLVKTCKDSCKHLIMGRVQFNDEFFLKGLISKKKKKKRKRKENKERKEERKKERKVLFRLLDSFTF